MDLAASHTLVFSVREFSDNTRLAGGQIAGHQQLFKIIAHALKYSAASIAGHLRKYEIDGIEIWNSQKDFGHMLSLGFLNGLKDELVRCQRHLFFGCHIHDFRLTITNVLSGPSVEGNSVELNIGLLTRDEFVARNLTTDIEYQNGAESTYLRLGCRRCKRGPVFGAKCCMVSDAAWGSFTDRCREMRSTH